jgi:hypothetical protein
MTTYTREEERVDRYVHGERAPAVEGCVIANCRDSMKYLHQVRNVMRSVAAARTLDDISAGDEQLRRGIPEWLTAAFAQPPSNSPFRFPYSLGGWIAEMLDGGWEWWSSAIEADHIIIRLWLQSHPYSTSALEFLLWAAGAHSVSVKLP